MTEIGNFIFRDCLSESQLTPQTVKMVKSRLKMRNAALLYSDTDPNRAGSHGFKPALQDGACASSPRKPFQPGDDEFSAASWREIAASHPDALFVTAPAHTAAEILIQARRVRQGRSRSSAATRSIGQACCAAPAMRPKA